jgi:transketolase
VNPQMPAIIMRRSFADLLHEKMTGDARIWVVTGDMGYKMWDRVKMDFPERFVNTGAAEQVMVGLSVGLALEGKIPFVYSITPFLLYRPFETIRNYVNREKVPVKLVSSGRNRDYSQDGFSHWAEEDKEIMKIFRNIRSRWPETKEEIPGLVEEMINNPVPYYINLRK